MSSPGLLPRQIFQSSLFSVTKKQLTDKQKTVFCGFQENYEPGATFKDILDFIEKKIAKVPVFGDIKDTPINRADI